MPPPLLIVLILVLFSCTEDEKLSPDVRSETGNIGSRSATTTLDLQNSLNYYFAIDDATNYRKYESAKSTLDLDLSNSLSDLRDTLAFTACNVLDDYSNSHKDILYYEIDSITSSGGLTELDLIMFIGLDTLPATGTSSSNYDCCLNQGSCDITGDEDHDFEDIYQAGLNNTEAYTLDLSNDEYWSERESKVFFIGPNVNYNDMHLDYVDQNVDVSINDLWHNNPSNCGGLYSGYWTPMEDLIQNNKPAGKKVMKVDVGWFLSSLTEGTASFYYHHGLRVDYGKVKTHAPIPNAPFEVKLECP